MTTLVVGVILLVAGLVLAFNLGGLGSAWIRADLRWTTRRSEEVMQRRERRRRAYFWFLAICGAVFTVIGIFGVL
jgi:hypothetical protein